VMLAQSAVMRLHVVRL